MTDDWARPANQPPVPPPPPPPNLPPPTGGQGVRPGPAGAGEEPSSFGGKIKGLFRDPLSIVLVVVIVVALVAAGTARR